MLHFSKKEFEEALKCIWHRILKARLFKEDISVKAHSNPFNTGDCTTGDLKERLYYRCIEKKKEKTRYWERAEGTNKILSLKNNQKMSEAKVQKRWKELKQN